MQQTKVLFLDWEDPLEKKMAIHSSFLAWKIPQKKEPGGIQSMRLQRVWDNWATMLNVKKGIINWSILSSLLSIFIATFTFIFHVKSKEHCKISQDIEKKVKSLSRVWFFVTPWTVAYQAPPSMGFFQTRVLERAAISFSFRVLNESCFKSLSSHF